MTSAAIRRYIDLITVLTHKELKVRYKNSTLGYMWSIAHPLAQALVFFIAFKMVMRIQIENYSLFLITGLFAWQWISNSIIISPNAFISNASIIKKVFFPRNIIPFTLVLQDMIHFLLSIPVIVGFMLYYNKYPSISWLYGLPALAIIQFLVVYGVALTLASINLFFRDMERLTIICMNLLFYFTPVFYPDSMVPDKFKFLLLLNPAAVLVSGWRHLFLDGSVSPTLLLVGFAEGIVILSVGLFVYKRLSWKFAEAL